MKHNGQHHGNYRSCVIQVQKWLNICRAGEDLPRIYPDGFYGEETARAVMLFQEQNGLPVTGKTDYRTWCLLSEKAACGCPPEPLPVSPFSVSLKNGRICVGDFCDTALFVKLLMHTLSADYDCFADITPDPHFSEADSDALREFQKLHGLPPSGEADIPTWNLLAEGYRRISSDRQQ